MTDKEKYVLSHYEISSTGQVFSTLSSRTNFQRYELKQRTDKDGYKDVTLVYDNKGSRHPFRIHRLVALNYLPNENNLPIVNHKDLNKSNNSVENLEWSTVALNTQHGYDNCCYNHIQKIKITLENGTILIFPSQSHAARYFKYRTPAVISYFLTTKTPPNSGKLKNAIIEYTTESVTTIERNPTTVSRV